MASARKAIQGFGARLSPAGAFEKLSEQTVVDLADPFVVDRYVDGWNPRVEGLDAGASRQRRKGAENDGDSCGAHYS